MADSETDEVLFFASKWVSSASIERVSSVVYEDRPEKYVWERREVVC